MQSEEVPHAPAAWFARLLFLGPLVWTLVSLAACDDQGGASSSSSAAASPGASSTTLASASASSSESAPVAEATPSTSAQATPPDPSPTASATGTAVAQALAPAAAKSPSNSAEPAPSAAPSASPSAVASTSPTAAPEAPLTVQSDKVQADHFGVWMQTAKSYKAGQAGSVEVVLVPKGEFHCNDAYPYKVKLGAAPAGVAYPQEIVRGASISPARTSMRVPFTATVAGPARLSGKFYFSVCKADQCVIDSREVAAAIQVE